MHITFFNRAYDPEVSATSQLLTDLAEGLVHDHGCRVTVVAGWPSGGLRRAAWGHLVIPEHRRGVEVLRAWGTTLSKCTLAGRATNYLTYFGSACVAGFQIDRPDVVIALTDPPIVGLAALLAARRFHARFAISYRDLFPEVARLLTGSRNPGIEWALHRVNRILIGQADRVIALGSAMRRRLIEEKGAPADKVVILPDWADCMAIVPGPKDNPFAQTHGLADRFVIMHAGNLGVSQNLSVLVQAMVHLADLPDVVLVFVGDGVTRGTLQAQVDQLGLTTVRFLPFQPRDQLSQVFASADCFIVSLKPGLSGYIMPSKLYAILAAGRPYVAAVEASCDVARITREYECGLLAQSDDPRDLADKIRRLHQDRELGQRMGERARRASVVFDRRRGVEAYLKMCQELVTERKRRG